MATKASAKNVTLVRAMRVLDLFREHERLSLPEMAALSGLPKTTVFRMAGALEEMGFLSRDDRGTYRLGLRFLEFGQLVTERLDLRRVALPVMQALRDEVGDAVNLVVRDGREAIYIEKVEALAPVRVYTRIGRRAPLYAGACPRVLLAYLPEDEQERYLQEVALVPIGAGTITDRQRLRACCGRHGKTNTLSAILSWKPARRRWPPRCSTTRARWWPASAWPARKPTMGRTGCPTSSTR